MILKLDLEKAYDRMEWVCVEGTLRDAGLPSAMTNVIMGLIHKSSCCLHLNGQVTDILKLSYGLKQGDPLSLYLFVLCLERLSHWIQKRVNEGAWKPLKASKGGLKVSHLFFVDDLVQFVEAT